MIFKNRELEIVLQLWLLTAAFGLRNLQVFKAPVIVNVNVSYNKKVKGIFNE